MPLEWFLDGWDTGLQLFNLGSAPAAVQVIYQMGAQPMTELMTIAAGTGLTLYQPANPRLPDGYVGSATVIGAPGAQLSGVVNEVRTALARRRRDDQPLVSLDPSLDFVTQENDASSYLAADVERALSRLAPAHREAHRRGGGLPGQGGDLQRLPAEGGMHRQQPGPPGPLGARSPSSGEPIAVSTRNLATTRILDGPHH